MMTSDGFCDMGARAVVALFRENGILISEWIKVPSNAMTDAEADSYIDRLKERGRSEESRSV